MFRATTGEKNMNHRGGIEEYTNILQKLGKKVNSATCLQIVILICSQKGQTPACYFTGKLHTWKNRLTFSVNSNNFIHHLMVTIY